MLSKKLLTKEYYYNLMTMFIKESYGTKEWFSYYIDILNNINDVIDQYLSCLNVYDETYPSFLVKRFGLINGEQIPNNLLYYKNSNDQYILTSNELYDETKTYYFKENNTYQKFINNYEDFKILDSVGNIFNAKRTVKLNDEIITLSNLELLSYIKLCIAIYNYDGTTSKLIDMYNSAGFTVLIETSGSLTCNLFLDTNTTVSENLRKLFLYTSCAECLGIEYYKSTVDSFDSLITLTEDDSGKIVFYEYYTETYKDYIKTEDGVEYYSDDEGVTWKQIPVLG